MKAYASKCRSIEPAANSERSGTVGGSAGREDACQRLNVDRFCEVGIEAGFERPLFVLRLSPPRHRNDDNGFL